MPPSSAPAPVVMVGSSEHKRIMVSLGIPDRVYSHMLRFSYFDIEKLDQECRYNEIMDRIDSDDEGEFYVWHLVLMNARIVTTFSPFQRRFADVIQALNNGPPLYADDKANA